MNGGVILRTQATAPATVSSRAETLETWLNHDAQRNLLCMLYTGLVCICEKSTYNIWILLANLIHDPVLSRSLYFLWGMEWWVNKGTVVALLPAWASPAPESSHWALRRALRQVLLHYSLLPWPELVLCSVTSIHLETETSALDKSSAHTTCLWDGNSQVDFWRLSLFVIKITRLKARCIAI